MTDTKFVVVENVAQDYSKDRTDLTNEEVVTLPVVYGPTDSFDKAEWEARDNPNLSVVEIHQ